MVVVFILMMNYKQIHLIHIDIYFFCINISIYIYKTLNVYILIYYIQHHEYHYFMQEVPGIVRW